MNDLVIAVNNKIKDIIRKGHAGKIEFVNIDPYVRLLQGRFCERGIVEPADKRPGLLFYNFGTSDGKDDYWLKTELKRAPEEISNVTFEAQIASKFEQALKEHPDWRPKSDGIAVSVASSDDSSKVKAAAGGGFLSDTITSFLPDTFKRIFHPRPYLHRVIASLVLAHIVNDRAQALGQPRTPLWVRTPKLSGDACKTKPGSRTNNPPRGLVCDKTEWRAPKEQTADGSTSVVAAIKDFCRKRNGQTPEKRTDHEHIYDRWDISGWGVTKRQSLWLRASSGPFSQCPKGTIEEKDCVTVLTDGLYACDSGADYTQGLTAQGNNCIEYAVKTSASVHEGDPPWAEHVRKYPPPETLMADAMQIASKKHQIDCYTGRGGKNYQKWNWDDANAAIDQYCNNNLDYGGHTKEFSVKRPGLVLSASVRDARQNKQSPYSQKEWCA